ncbi:Replication protein [Streptococcus sp. DD10]|nr:Replication protein [Streptococcus sp. DD10]
MKYSYQAERVIEEALVRYPKGRFLFLTLTVKNVTGENLNQTLSKITEGFRRLMQYKKVDKNLIGFLRATEVTYSQKREDYHPHLHVLLMVKSSYFTGNRGNSENYISQEEWTKLWQKAMKLDYTPMVDIRAVKNKAVEKDKGFKKAILETAKYPVKPFDMEKDKDGNKIILSEDEKLQIVDDMMNGLHRKRQIGFGKLFKEIKKEMDFDDIENGNLIQTGDEEIEKVSAVRQIIAVWNWQRMNYFIKE